MQRWQREPLQCKAPCEAARCHSRAAGIASQCAILTAALCVCVYCTCVRVNHACVVHPLMHWALMQFTIRHPAPSQDHPHSIVVLHVLCPDMSRCALCHGWQVRRQSATMLDAHDLKGATVLQGALQGQEVPEVADT